MVGGNKFGGKSEKKKIEIKEIKTKQKQKTKLSVSCNLVVTLKGLHDEVLLFKLLMQCGVCEEVMAGRVNGRWSSNYRITVISK